MSLAEHIKKYEDIIISKGRCVEPSCNICPIEKDCEKLSDKYVKDGFFISGNMRVNEKRLIIAEYKLKQIRRKLQKWQSLKKKSYEE